MKKRIDVLLVDMGFFPSREQARRTIMTGNVFVDNQRVDKPGTMVKDDADILVKGKPLAYVWTLVHQRVALQTVCYKMELQRFTLLMLVMVSWPGS